VTESLPGFYTFRQIEELVREAKEKKKHILSRVLPQAKGGP